MSWNRMCNIEETKIPIINGRKFTLKLFWAQIGGFQYFLEFVLEKFKKAFIMPEITIQMLAMKVTTSMKIL